MLADEVDYVLGVDTHRDEHVVAVVTAPAGAVVAGKTARANGRGYRDLLVLLASELYHRERGTLPPSEDTLVGTYLESLPDDGSAEVGDETTPTVSDSASSAQPPPR